MNRWIWAAIAGAAVAIVAVIAVAFIAVGQDSDSTHTPNGSETRMRLEAVNDEVSCGQIAAVRVWLDDLTFRESDREAGVPAGMAGFQVTLQYDPTILRVLSANDIELNDDLGDQDVDDDGLVRSFIPAVTLSEEHLGRVAAGAIGFVQGSQGGEDNREEGVDPVTKGEPLLLMTVRFTPVGTGATSIRLEGWQGALARVEPQVFDTDGVFYEPLEIENTEVTVTDGDCAEAPASPTADPTSTPIVVPTRTPAPWRTVEPTDAPAVGRSDCPADWAAYAEPQERYSICYPAEFPVNASDTAISVSNEGDRQAYSSLSLQVSIGDRPYFEFTPSTENCALVADSLLGHESSGPTTISINGRNVAACLHEGRYTTIQGATPLAGDQSPSEGFIRFTLTYETADPVAAERATAMLDSLRVVYR